MHASKSSPRRITGMLLLLFILSLRCPALADVTIVFDKTDGSTVNENVPIRIRVTGSEDLNTNKVELAVDDQVIDSKNAVPYQFTWNTMKFTDGKHKITAIATDDKGNKTKAEITLNVDNGLDKGVEFHAKAALELIQNGDLDGGQKALERAIRIDAAHPMVVRATAAMLRKRGNFREALDTILTLPLPDNDVPTRQERSSFMMSLAFSAKTPDEFLLGAQGALNMYKQMLAIKKSKIKPDGSAGSTFMQNGDQSMAEHQWASAASEYRKSGSEENMHPDMANRLALALLYSGKLREANGIISGIISGHREDPATRALNGMYLLMNHQADKAREAVMTDVDAKATYISTTGIKRLASWIIAAYADIALGKKDRARIEAQQALSLAPQLADTQMLMIYVTDKPEEARSAIGHALEQDPSLPQAYIANGFQSLLMKGDKNISISSAMFDMALNLDPGNILALAGKILYFQASKKPAVAQKLLTKLILADKRSPDLHVIQAYNYMLSGYELGIQPELKAANQMNDKMWTDSILPKPEDLIRRVFEYRICPALSPASLYPSITSDLN